MTFVFTNQVDGKLVPVDSVSPKVQKKELHRPRRNVERISTPFSSHNKLVPPRSASHSTSIAWKKEATNCEITKKVGMDVASNTKNSLVNEISKQKRSCPINDEHSLLNEVSQKKICHVVISDDDFE